MVARADVKRLSGSIDTSVKLQVVRHMKNQCIGNRSKKLQFLAAGVVPLLVDLLKSKETAPELAIQAVTVLGSLSYKLEDGASALLSSGGLPAVVNGLSSQTDDLVHASVRSLQFLLQNEKVRSQVHCDPAALERLAMLLQAEDHSLRVSAAHSIAKLCGKHEVAVLAEAVPPLVAMLSHGHRQQEAAASALQALTHHKKDVLQRLHQAGGTPYLLEVLYNHSLSVRLNAACILVDLVSFSCLPQDKTESAVTEPLLSALVNLLGESHPAEAHDLGAGVVASLLADLLNARPQLQSRGADTSAVPCLTERLTAKPPLNSEELCSVLRALAELMLNQESCRNKLLESKEALPAIVSALGLQQPPAVQVAGTECVRALSRSAKTQRLGLCSVDVARPLAALLAKGSPAVQAAACAACCNLVLDFSPFKAWLVEEGGIPRLLDATRSMDTDLRLNGVWAVQNLAHKADLKVKQAIMKNLPWSEVETLLSDSEVSVRERTLNLIKNLVADGPKAHQAAAEWAADEGNPDSGPAKLIAALAAPLSQEASASQLQIHHALMAIANLCSGKDEMQQAVMAGGVAPTLVTWLRHDSAAVRESATWCIHNLVGRRGLFPVPAAVAAAARAAGRAVPQQGHLSQWSAELARLGVPQALAALEQDDSRAVRRNATNSLARFSEADRAASSDDRPVPMPVDV